ncbi:MAG: hypothetical protein J6P87_02155, partial [Lachnospiraceae bacterium]|nr:hypothetical protein [Lachnospiraceae bacterium]
VPELAVANGEDPWNPVHIIYYDQDKHEAAECAAFSMYGKIYYEEHTGVILPMYYIPVMMNSLFRFGHGDIEPYEAVTEPDLRPVFSEFRPMRLDDYPDEDILREALQRAVGLSYMPFDMTGIWQAEDPDNTYPYLELENEHNFAVYDEDGYIVYMGVVFDAEDGDPHGMKSYELRTPDGGLFELMDWYTADDPLNDRISFTLDPQSFIRYTDTGGGKPVRSPGIYLETDIQFLGDWYGSDGDTVLSIDNASAMSGGYALTADLGDGLKWTGFAAPAGDELYITQAELEGKSIGGTIAREDNTIILTVTYSSHPDLEEGAVYTFSY